MTLELSELAGRLADLRAALAAGERVRLTDAGREVACVHPTPPPVTAEQAARRFGCFPGLVQYMAPDFDAPMMLVPDPDAGKGG